MLVHPSSGSVLDQSFGLVGSVILPLVGTTPARLLLEQDPDPEPVIQVGAVAVRLVVPVLAHRGPRLHERRLRHQVLPSFQLTPVPFAALASTPGLLQGLQGFRLLLCFRSQDVPASQHAAPPALPYRHRGRLERFVPAPRQLASVRSLQLVSLARIVKGPVHAVVGSSRDLGSESVRRVLATKARPLPGHESESPSVIHVVAAVEPELPFVVTHLVVGLEQVHHEHLHLHCPAPRPHPSDEHRRPMQLPTKPHVLHQLELGLHKGGPLLVHRAPPSLLAHVADAPPLLLLLDHEEVRGLERVEGDEVGHLQPASVDLLLDAVDGVLLVLDEVPSVAMEHQLADGVAAGGEADQIHREHVMVVVILHVR